MLPSINIRRRSTLGRRSNITGRPPVPVPVRVPSVTTSIGRNRSAKKTPMGKASKEYMARKRLFLNRSPNDVFLSIRQKGLSRGSPGLSVDSENSSLNVTGIRSIHTPSPDIRSTFLSGSSNSPVQLHRGEEGSGVGTKLDFNSERKAEEQKKPSINPYVYDCSKPPLSPGPSKYEAIIRKELDNLVPPEDPGDNVHMKKFLESLKSSSIEKCSSYKQSEPPIPTVVVSSISLNLDSKDTVLPNEMKLNTANVEKLCVIEEDEANGDNSFILAEQTILGNETVKKQETSKQNGPETIESNVCSQVEELQEAVVAIDKGIAGMEQSIKDMKLLKTRVLQLINKRQNPGNGKYLTNKENVPVNAEMKWFSSIKSRNPGLLKTPNMVKRTIARNDLINQSAILTPHSLSTVLNDQMEDLYSDEYY